MFPMIHMLCVSTLLFLNSRPGNALMCFECNSESNVHCGDVRQHQIQPVQCEEPFADSHYESETQFHCVTLIVSATYGGYSDLIRGCIEKDLTCDDVFVVRDNIEISNCSTCGTSGCNNQTLIRTELISF